MLASFKLVGYKDNILLLCIRPEIKLQYSKSKPPRRDAIACCFAHFPLLHLSPVQNLMQLNGVLALPSWPSYEVVSWRGRLDPICTAQWVQTT